MILTTPTPPQSYRLRRRDQQQRSYPDPRELAHRHGQSPRGVLLQFQDPRPVLID